MSGLKSGTLALADDATVVPVADLPDSYAIAALSALSDDGINEARISCAFGDATKVFNKIRADGYPTPPVVNYCVAVVDEAVKRGASADLFSAMQPGKAVKEWQTIVAASSENKDFYENVEEVTKELGCELAFDAGYVYGNKNPDRAIAPNIDDAGITSLTADCFNPATKTPTVNGLIAGARKAQAAAKVDEASKVEIERPNVPLDSEKSVITGSVNRN